MGRRVHRSGLARTRGDFVMGTAGAGSEGTTCARLTHDALDLSLDEKHIKNTSQFIFKKANKPSKEINWKTKEVKEIVERMERFSFLKMYLDQAPIDC